MGCDSCYWNVYCSGEELDLNINGGNCDYYDDIYSDGRYTPDKGEYYKEFFEYMKEDEWNQKL